MAFEQYGHVVGGGAAPATALALRYGPESGFRARAKARGSSTTRPHAHEIVAPGNAAGRSRRQPEQITSRRRSGAGGGS